MRRSLMLAAVVCLAPSLASATEDAAPRQDRRTDFTAYTRPRGRAAVGPFKLELGLIDEIMIGTYVPPWLAFTLIGAPAPNLYFKARSWWSGPFTLAVRGGFLYLDGSGLADLANVDATGNATSLTSEINASLRLGARMTLSLGAAYSHIEALGGGESVATSIEGASMADAVNVRLFGQWQLTRVFGVTLLGRYVAFQSPYGADVETQSPAVSIDGDLSADSDDTRQRFAVVPGVSFDWPNWELYVGVGYGSFQLPAVGLPTSRALPIIDLAVAYRFDLYQ